ncbi:Autophagy-related protein [Mycena indigotica]|uniref:Autophagy-related protein n=1 Tax=Mycena indigotica TaxID=2126181 RepID=A0A8H6WGT3_9AGAR|nr:Autophagy-related protein [Mycena indigotica]KAF7316231.1 Autophagy-related protein [Mycena indigotica]
MDGETTPKYWLLKAEPDSRVVKGKDVKFSVDDFETVGTSPWEGVRNFEARNLMKEMQPKEKAQKHCSITRIARIQVYDRLAGASDEGLTFCTQGIAAFAEVAKAAYPDHTAWDSEHPYFDAKSKQEDPKWFMVDLAFVSRTKHFVPLALLRYIADSSADSPPEELDYLGEAGVAAIKNMDLVTRGRLSIQRVSPDAWDAIEQLADNGGWDELDLSPKKKTTAKKAPAERTISAHPRAAKQKPKPRKKKAKGSDSEDDFDEDDEWSEEEVISKTTSSRRKRKAEDYQELPATRRRTKA